LFYHAAPFLCIPSCTYLVGNSQSLLYRMLRSPSHVLTAYY
jgi:predicted DNA-binding transcriptional regulator AlpA